MNVDVRLQGCGNPARAHPERLPWNEVCVAAIGKANQEDIDHLFRSALAPLCDAAPLAPPTPPRMVPSADFLT